MNIGEYFGFIIIIGVVQFSTTFIIPKENDKLEEFRFAKHDFKRFRREKCETQLYYDVTCHGLCPYTEKDWEKNKVFMNCSDGLAYHCARDNKTNEYVEACAEAIRCDRGKEPRLIFPAGHNKTARVICRYCHDEDFYNPIEFRLSSTYYECTEYKYPCSRYGIGKIRCDEDGIERHWKDNKCRCNERKMYIESNAACQTDFPCKDKTNFDFTCELYDCGKTSHGYWRNLTKDYCCACEDGYIRNETSNKCHKSSHDFSLQTTKISHHYTNITMTSTATILMSSEVKINITASTKLTTHRDITISYIQPTATAIPSLSGAIDIIFKISIPVILIFIGGIICYKFKKKGHDEPFDSPQSEKLLTDPRSDYIQNKASSAQQLTSQSKETSLPNKQNEGGSVQLQSFSSDSVQDPSSDNIQNEASSAQQLTSQSVETSLPNNQNERGSVQLQSFSSASVQDPSSDNIQNKASSAQQLTSQSEEASLPENQNAGASVPSAPVQDPSSDNIQNKASSAQQLTSQSVDPSSANNQNGASFTQPLTNQSEETIFANNRNAGGSAQQPSVSSDSVQDSSTMTTTNVFSKENDMRIAEIGKIKMQQEIAKIARNLNDTLTKERVTLEKLQVSSSVIQNAAGIDHPRIASVSSDISQESSSANDQIVPGPAKLSKTITPYNTDSEGSSADHIQNTLGIVQLRRDSVCSQANNQNEAASVQLPSPAQPFINQNEDSSLPYNQNEAVSAQLPRTADPSITESEDSRFANYQNKAASAQLPRTPDPFITQSEGSDTEHAIHVSLSNCNNKR